MYPALLEEPAPAKAFPHPWSASQDLSCAQQLVARHAAHEMGPLASVVQSERTIAVHMPVPEAASYEQGTPAAHSDDDVHVCAQYMLPLLSLLAHAPPLPQSALEPQGVVHRPVTLWSVGSLYSRQLFELQSLALEQMDPSLWLVESVVAEHAPTEIPMPQSPTPSSAHPAPALALFISHNLRPRSLRVRSSGIAPRHAP